tara:strand:- start:4190 stop:4525 length:336 start_codon:yes stop_codon:yes gene_type:complete
MLTTLLTFTQKVTAYAPLLENETATMVNCSMAMSHHESQMDTNTADCGNDSMPSTTDCQSDCEFMTVVSVLHFIEHEHAISQISVLLDYPTSRSDTPYYFPESLYRPPFLG